MGKDADDIGPSLNLPVHPFQRLGKTQISAWQASACGGRIGCTLDGGRVILTGPCRTVIEGTFFL